MVIHTHSLGETHRIVTWFKKIPGVINTIAEEVRKNVDNTYVEIELFWLENSKEEKNFFILE